MDNRPFRRIRQPTTPIEKGFFDCISLLHLEPFSVLSVFWDMSLSASFLSFVGLYEPAYSVMGFTDPFFIVLSFLTGLPICAMSGILTVLTILLSPNDSKADFIITMSLIAFGFGGATMRATFEAVQACLVEIITSLL